VWGWWALIGGIALCAALAAGYYLTRGQPAATAEESPSGPEKPPAAHVEVVHPQKGALDRSTTQPGSVQAFESVRLFAGVSGYLKTLNVDIGDRVKRGQVLAVVDVPELDKQVQRHASAVEQARAHVVQMKARVISAKAEVEAARAAVPQAEATAKSKAAALRFREKQYRRMQDLYHSKSIDERLVDESMEQRDAALEAKVAAEEGVTSARERLNAAAARVQQAEADVDEAAAEVKVAQAELEKAQVLVRFATMTAPFDGVITQRSLFPGDYVKAADEGGTSVPLLTVQRTDLMRVVVQIPDRDVPYCDPGDPAVVELDALPGQKIPTAKVSRVSMSEDAETRLMHVEVDVPNPTGKIRNGMYGRVTILLEKSKFLAVPAACLVGKVKDGQGRVYVVRNGHLQLTPVRIGADNGHQIGIAAGLSAEDEVVVHPGEGLADGALVLASSREAGVAAAH
jgi:RND family efflux transporter MFP subunit